MNPRFWIATYHNNSRLAAAEDVLAPPPVLRFIAADPASEGSVLLALADNPSAPADVLTWLAANRSSATGRGVMVNPSTPQMLREKLIAEVAQWDGIDPDNDPLFIWPPGSGTLWT